MRKTIFLGCMLASMLFSVLSFASGADIRVRDLYGDREYVYEQNGCRIGWTVSPKSDKKGIQNRIRCNRTVKEVIDVYTALFRRIKKDYPDKQWNYFFFGRLVGMPDYAVRLAKAAEEDKGPKPKSAQRNTYVKNLLNKKNTCREVQRMFRVLGYRATVSSVEKVLYGRAGKTPLADTMKAAELPAQQKVFFDALVWFKLVPLQGK